MHSTPVTLSPTAARRFALLATGLVGPHYRFGGYKEGDLHRSLHGLGDEASVDATPMPVNDRAELLYVADLVQSVQVEGCPALYCLRSDLALLDESASVGDDV